MGWKHRCPICGKVIKHPNPDEARRLYNKHRKRCSENLVTNLVFYKSIMDLDHPSFKDIPSLT